MSKKTILYPYYEEAVQDPEVEIKLFSKIYKSYFKKNALSLCEDFCGTFFMSRVWVQSSPQRTAEAVDLSTEPLTFGKKHHLSQLNDDQKNRLRVHQANVLQVKTKPVDIVVSPNFSICFFQKRKLLIAYLKSAKKRLNKQGVLIIDILGGADAHGDDYQKRKVRMPDGSKYTYIWDQSYYNPIDQRVIFHIHFEIPGKGKFKNAFTYDWRMWSIPELKDALEEVGFNTIDVYWEGDDGNGEGNGVFIKTRRAEPCPGWYAYVAAYNS